MIDITSIAIFFVVYYVVKQRYFLSNVPLRKTNIDIFCLFYLTLELAVIYIYIYIYINIYIYIIYILYIYISGHK